MIQKKDVSLLYRKSLKNKNTMTTQEITLKKIAIRNADALVQKIGQFDTIVKLTNMYDMLPKTGGTDRQLVVYMMNHLGYDKCVSGGWIKK